MSIPLDAVRVLNSENVFAYPVTTRLTDAAFRPNTMHLVFDKQGQWAGVEMDGAMQEATLWVLAQFDGIRYAAGMERLRPAQVDKPEPADPMGYIADWVTERPFGPFNTRSIPRGASIGLMVVQGDTRLATNSPLRERSGVVEVAYPPSGPILWHEGDVVPVPVPTPAPVPAPHPLPTPVPAPVPVPVVPVPAPVVTPAPVPVSSAAYIWHWLFGSNSVFGKLFGRR